MSIIGNKEREKHIFAIFRDKYGLSGEFVHGDNPDFTGPFNENTLGVEITEIYRPSKSKRKTIRESEIIKERIVSRSRDRANECGLPPLRVSVIFSGNMKYSREAELTEALFEIVKNNCPESGNRIDLDFYSGISLDFTKIFISNWPGAKIPVWFAMESGFINTDFSDEIQQIIDSKAKKITQYLTKCEKCWLIIAALGVSASNFYEISEKMTKVFYRSPFEKVFFVQVFDKTMKELNITQIGDK